MKRVVSPLLLLVSLAVACAHGGDLARSSNQLDFGVEAAKMNLWREALFRFQRAVQLDPDDAMARNNLAVAYEGIGEFDKARAAYLEALRLDKSNSYIQKNYSRFTEFTAKNRKREKKPLPDSAGTPARTPTPAPEAMPAPPVQPPPVTPIPPPAPVPPATSTGGAA